jgi:S-layer protein
LGDGTNVVKGASTGANTITGGAGSDTFITGTTGNNIINFGNGTNTFTATTGNNTYTGGTGVDFVSVGAANGLQGVNNITLGAGNDSVTLRGIVTNGNSYSTITDAAAGDIITFLTLSSATSTTTSTFTTAKITLAPTAAFADYLNAAATTTTTQNSAGLNNFAWFQFAGNTYIVDDLSATGGFVNGTDTVVQLTGLVTVNGFTGVVAGAGSYGEGTFTLA